MANLGCDETSLWLTLPPLSDRGGSRELQFARKSMSGDFNPSKANSVG